MICENTYSTLLWMDDGENGITITLYEHIFMKNYKIIIQLTAAEY
jgi:hypothetical protein